MTAKLDLFAADPVGMKHWRSLGQLLNAGLELSLIRLVEIRSSQLNGCANCINMHATEARDEGETEQRVYLLSAWREAPCYSARERAALAWTDALTQLSEDQHAHEEAYAELAKHFTEEERVRLTLKINLINGWNRLMVGFGAWYEMPDKKSVA
jgi:AhpD family alkylhydroperoxidase